jgi:type III secretion protein D
MQADHQAYALKVLSGPNLGAEIPLGEGQYLIGTDDSCDIILSDDQVAGRHLRLEITAGEIHIAAMDAAAFLDGEDTGGVESAVSFHQVVTIGATHLAIGPSGREWPIIQLPQPKPLPVEAEEEEETAPVETETAEAAADPEPQSLAEPPPQPAPAGRGKALGLIAAALVVLLTGGLVFIAAAPDRGAQRPVERKPDAQAIRDLLSTLDHPDLEVVGDPRGRLTIQGYVDRVDQKKGIVTELRKRGINIRIQVKSGDQLVTAVKETLTALGYDLDIEWGGEGRIVVKGAATDKSDFQSALAMVKQDIPAIRQIDDQVVTNDAILSRFGELLNQFGLRTKVRAKTYPDHLLAAGTIEPGDADRWQALKQEYQSRYGEQVPIRDSVSVSRMPADDSQAAPTGNADLQLARLGLPPPQRPDLNIQSVSIGPVRYLIDQTGHKYFVGARLNNGFRITAIDDRGVTVARNGVQTRVNIAGSRE